MFKIEMYSYVFDHNFFNHLTSFVGDCIIMREKCLLLMISVITAYFIKCISQYNKNFMYK